VKFCYLILAQRFPGQLAKLVEAIDSDDSFICIHLDADENLEEFRKELAERPNLVFIENRVKCIWGHRSMIDAELVLLNATRGVAQYYVLLSDQHYPVRPPQALWAYLQEHQLDGIIETHYDDPLKQFKKRIDYVTFFYGKNRGEYVRMPPIGSPDFLTVSTLKKLATALYRRQLFKLSRLWTFPELAIDIKWGSQWWILSDFVVDRILAWQERNPEFYNASEHRLIVDEYFFQSILNHLNLSRRVLYEPATFVTRRAIPPHDFPQLFKAEDIDLFASLPDHVFFARKFDVASHPEIVSMLSLRLDVMLADGGAVDGRGA